MDDKKDISDEEIYMQQVNPHNYSCVTMFHKSSHGLWLVAKQLSKKLCIPTLGYECTTISTQR